MFSAPLRNLPIRWKLAIVILLMFIPTLMLCVSFWNIARQSIAQAQGELVGIAYIMPIRRVFEQVAQHRALANAALAGDSGQRERLNSLIPGIEESWRILEELEARQRNSLETATRLQHSKQRWEAIQKTWGELSAAQSLTQHSALLADLRALIQYVAERSGLILDPAFDSYYLMDIVVNALPASIEDLGVMRILGNTMTVRQALTLEEQVRFGILAERLRSSLQTIQQHLHTVYNVQAGLEPRLAPSLTQARNATEAFLRATTSIQQEQSPGALAEHAAFGNEAIQQFFGLYDSALQSLHDVVTERFHAARLTLFFNLGLALLLLVIAGIIAMSTHRFISTQVEDLSTLFTSIAMGDFEARAQVMSEDELGEVASSLNIMLDNTLSLIQSQDERDSIQNSILKLLEEVSDVAQGDLRVEAEVTADITGAIADSFNYMIAQLRTLVSRVQEATLQVSASANEVQTTAEHLAQGSMSQAAQIVDSSAALDEMAVSIQQVSENATLSASVAEQSLVIAQKGATSVRNTIEGMTRIRTQVQETGRRIKRLGERSQEISEIVQLIGDIADRTSILALNAAIQAARAGEAGRAFTVVAEEVERLAERATEATKQIGNLVNTIQSETNEAVTAMDDTTREVVEGSRLAEQAGQALGDIEHVSTRLAELIQSISLAANQQARGSESLSIAMNDISEVTQQTAAGTKQAAVAISNLAALADELRLSVSTFKLPAATNGRRN